MAKGKKHEKKNFFWKKRFDIFFRYIVMTSKFKKSSDCLALSFFLMIMTRTVTAQGILYKNMIFPVFNSSMIYLNIAGPNFLHQFWYGLYQQARCCYISHY